MQSLTEFLSLVSSDVALQDKLKNLKEISDQACEKAAQQEKFSNEPVNWADFGCVESNLIVQSDGDWFWDVCIEEASPSTGSELKEYIHKEILKKFDPLGKWVQVSFEW